MATRSSHRNHREPAVLPDDVLIEILSRVPYTSVCRFKLVSKSWLACSSPDVRKRSPQTLAGFFCHARGGRGRRFLSTSGNTTGRPPADPSFPFLRAFKGFAIADSCNGLLLCGCWTHDASEYVVCNPATEEWLVLPHNPRRSSASHRIVRTQLGFEPAVSPHFTVFVFSSFPPGGLEVWIYPSETGEWTYKQSEYWRSIDVSNQTSFHAQAVFLNGALYMTNASSTMLTVDKDGNTLRKSQMPRMKGYGDWSINHSRGCLYATHINNVSSQLTVLVLEDCDSDRWVIKHTTSLAEVFGRQGRTYYVLAFCPDRNMIFLQVRMGRQSDLMSYDMDTGKGHVVCSLEEYFLLEAYTPCFAEWLSDGHSQI